MTAERSAHLASQRAVATHGRQGAGASLLLLSARAGGFPAPSPGALFFVGVSGGEER
jgi:hypothetical protein